MKRKYLIENPCNNRLVIFFTGWSIDWRILKDITLPGGYDLMCLWNYEDRTWENLKRQYEEVIIIAWSFGVPVANQLFGVISQELNVTGLFAVNGSIYPVDDERGIPLEIFINTLKNLDERNLYKFKIRIAGGLKRYLNHEGNFPENDDISSLKKELSCFKDDSFSVKENPVWDYVFISGNDKIYPPDNLKKGWDNTPYKVLEGEEHLPDFQNIFNLLIKDKQNVVRKFEKALFSYEENAIAQKELADSILCELKKSENTFENILEIGGGSGILTRKLQNNFPQSSLVVLDIVKGCEITGVETYEGDAETILKKFPEKSFELVVSSSTFQWFHSPYRCMKEIYRMLKENGTFAFTTYYEGTFREISDLSGQGLLYLTPEEWESLVKKAGFEIEIIKLNPIKLYFEKASDVFSHLRSTGVNGIAGRNRKIGEIKKMMEDYPVKNDKYPLTYETLLLIAVK